MDFRFVLSLFVAVFSHVSVFAMSQSNRVTLYTDDGPPHMIKASSSGIDVDIAMQVFASLDMQVDLVFAPLKRGMRQVIDKKAHAFLPTFYQQDTDTLFVSSPIIHYRPTIFVLTKNLANWKDLNSINDQRIITFQGAGGYFGQEFVQMSKRNNYRELHDMSIIPQMLLHGHADIAVLDYYIFYFYLNQIKDQELPAITELTFIPQVSAHVGFYDENLRNQFNIALKKFLAQKKDQQVILKYIGTAP